MNLQEDPKGDWQDWGKEKFAYIRRTPAEAMQNLKDILSDHPDLLTRVLELKDGDDDGRKQLEEELREALGDDGLQNLVEKTAFAAEFRGRFDIGVSPTLDAESLMGDGDAFRAPVPGLASLYKSSGVFKFDLYELPEEWQKKD